jgi:hypothetical protein
MQVKHLSAVLAATALSTALAASAAHAACGNRPGTPNEVKAEAISATSIRFSWRNTTSRAHVGQHTMYFDISVRDGKGNQVGKDMGGHGPFNVTYGSRSHQDFDRLATPQTLCFSIRARTEGGTKGCVSQRFSAQVCATTTASASPSTRPVKPLGAPVIAATREPGNVFYVRGFRFQPNAPVTIRAVDGATMQGALITSIGGQRITARASGLMSVRLYNICSKAQGPMHFSTNDGRPNPADKTGTLWSNTVTVACQR